MAQQTAVEWFYIETQDYVRLSDTVPMVIKIEIPFEKYMNILKQAKQMEKEQMKNIWGGGKWSVELGGEFEQYYNETYGGQGSPDTTTSPTK